MPKTNDLEGFLEERPILAAEDCEKFYPMGDVQNLDLALIESWRKSPIWAVMSKSIRATVYGYTVKFRDKETSPEERTWIAGYLEGLEYIHNIIWVAMKRRRDKNQAGVFSPEANRALLSETAREIQQLEEEFK